MLIQNIYIYISYVGYVGTDRKGAEFIGNKRTYKHSTLLLVQTVPDSQLIGPFC